MYPLFKPLWKAYLFLMWGGLAIFTSYVVWRILHEVRTGANMSSTEMRNHLVLSGVIYVICIFVFSLIIVMIGDKEYQKLVDNTLLKGKTQAFIDASEQFQKMVEKHPRRFTKPYILRIVLTLAIAYLDIGDYQTAKITLEQLPNLENKKSDKALKASYLSAWCSYYLGVNDLEQAEQYFEKFCQLIDSHANLKSQFMDSYRLYKAVFSMAKGDFEDAEATLKVQLKNAKNLLQEVYCHLLLGEVYLHENRLNEAHDILEFVIRNGGDTHYVNDARELLNQIQLLLSEPLDTQLEENSSQMSWETDYHKIFENCTEDSAKPLDLVSDDELSIAVMLQLLETAQDHKDTLKLPVPCQYVTAMFRVLDRAYMECFEQVYCDGDITPFVTTAIDGLLAIGEDELATVIKKSYAVYEDNIEKVWQANYENDVNNQGWSELVDLDLWAEIDEEFNISYAKCDYLRPSVATYVRENFRNFLNL